MRSASNEFKNLKKLPSKVLILDHDETIAISEKKSTGEYILQKDGSINATIMDKELLLRVVNLAKKHEIPIHVVTARTDNIPGDRKVVESIIEFVDGFHDGIGGFKREHLHFVGTSEDGQWKLKLTKLEMVEKIYNQHYSHLPREALLFVDDMVKYLEGVKNAGFKTCLADPVTKSHFAIIEQFLSISHENTYQTTLFKNAIKTDLVEKVKVDDKSEEIKGITQFK